MGRPQWVAFLAFLAAAFPHTGLAKEFLVEWDVPANGLILPSVSTAKCGDTIRFKCPPHATQGVYKMTSVNGTCPHSFDIPSAGVVLSAPTRNCDFTLTVGDEPDYFVTSQAPGACQQNLKMHVHAVCVAQTTPLASTQLGMDSMSRYFGDAGLNTMQPFAGMTQPNTGLAHSSMLDASGKVPGMTADVYTAMPPGTINQNMGYVEEAGTVNAAGTSRLSVTSVVGAVIAAVTVATAAL